MVSCDIWKAAGRPRSGPIFRNYRRDKSAYRYGIRSKRISDTEVYILHEALMEKQGASFWKCWKSKFEKGTRSLNSVNGITDSSVIAEHFVSHFSKSCSSNNVNAASRLSKKYVDMRAYYIGGRIDDSYKFDDIIHPFASKYANRVYGLSTRVN